MRRAAADKQLQSKMNVKYMVSLTSKVSNKLITIIDLNIVGYGKGPGGRNLGKSKTGEADLLLIGEQGFHVVPTLLLMLRLLGEYLAFQDTAPAFAPEVARRVVELLKVRPDAAYKLPCLGGIRTVNLCLVFPARCQSQHIASMDPCGKTL